MDDLSDVVSGALGAPPQNNDMVVNISGTSGKQDASSKYDALFAKAGQQYGVDPQVLKGVARTESSFNPNAVSKDANGNPLAHGLMQFTLPTAKAIGVNDPYDPSQAIPGAARLLRQNIDASGGDVKTALMMYHGGTNTNNWGPKTQAYPGKVLGTTQPPSDPSAFSADDVISALSGKSAQGVQPGSMFQMSAKSQVPPPVDKGPAPMTLTGAPVGFAENGLHMASGIAGQIAGGLAGLVTGNADNVGKVQDALTYEPRTDDGKAIVKNMGLGAEQLKSLAMGIPGVAQVVHGYQGANDALGAVSPVAGALMKAAPTAAGLLLAPEARGAFGGAAADVKAIAGRMMTPAEQAARIEPMLAKPRVKLNNDGSTTPVNTPPVAAPTGVTPEMMSKPAAPAATPAVQAVIENTSPLNTNQTAVARHAEASSLPIPVNLTAGQAQGNGAQFSFEKNMRGKYPEIGATLDAQNGQLVQNFDAIKKQVAPDISASGSDLGQAHVNAYKNMDAVSTTKISENYQALKDANGGEFPVAGHDIATAADKGLKSENVTRFLPSEVKGILDDIREPGAMQFNDFQNYLTILSQQARKAARAGDGSAEHAIGVVRNAFESLPMADESAHLKPLLDAARGSAKERFDRIAADPAYKAAINDGVAAGEPSPLANNFIKDYVVKGKTANVQNMINNLSGDPKNLQVMRAGVLDHLKDVSGIDMRTNAGNVSQSGLNNALEQMHQGNKTALILGDQGAQSVNTLGNVARYTMEQKPSSFVNNSNTTTSAIANGAKELALGVGNVHTYGGLNFVRGRMAASAEKAMVAKSIAPGAGIKISDFP
jgi:hypothetical protein